MRVPLACTVRDCGLPLTRDGWACRCPRGHAFDVARRGYVNLLQPQDRRSLTAGDSRAAVDARARLIAAGAGAQVLEGFVERARRLVTREAAVVVDLGSGTGEALARLAASSPPVTTLGIDLSAAAIAHAAARDASGTWIVANADRRLPLLDVSVDLVLSLHARRNPAECARVLAPGGHLLVAVPAPDDLVELRTSVLGEAVARDRSDVLVAEHGSWFELHDRVEIRQRQVLPRAVLLDLLATTYRGARASAATRVEAITDLEVTFASSVLTFTPR